MAKAIKITQEIKDKNAKYRLPFVENNAVGEIVRTSLPTKFYVTEPISGSYQIRTDLHALDGWKDIVEPSYDPETQKLGNTVIEVGNDFTYEVIALTQQEQDAYTQAQEDADDASQFFDQRKADGERYIERFNAYVYRQVVNAQITKQQAITALEFFYDALHPLTMGYFELAKNNVSALSGGTQINTLRDKITSELQTYLDNE